MRTTTCIQRGWTIMLMVLVAMSQRRYYQCNAQKMLDTSSFEHTTQAATGQTTGIWVVRFCDPENPRCQKMQPSWNEFAEKMLEDQIFVADIDVAKDSMVAKRFNFDDKEKIPAILMLRRGSMYTKVASDDVNEIEEWVIRGWENQDSQPVPPEQSMILMQLDEYAHALAGKLNYHIEQAVAKFNILLEKNNIQFKLDIRQSYRLIMVVMSAILVVILLMLRILKGNRPTNAQKKSQ